MKQFLGLLLVSFCAGGCTPSAGAALAAATPDANGNQVAAKIGSRSFSNSELDTHLTADLAALKERAEAGEQQLRNQLEELKGQVREQEYNLRKKALTGVLYDMEAQSRGISRDDLIMREITSKAAVTPMDTDALWEEVKSRAKGSTKEQVLPQLTQMASQRKLETRTAAFQRELFRKHNVTLIGLQPARKTVTFPADAPTMGPADAPVTIVEFTDYQCPYCQAAQQYVDRVMDAYKGQVRLVYQEFPLDFHSQAKPAGRAARCAGEQGKFWEMHTGLLRTPGAFDDADLQNRATGLGIDAKSFGSCIASNKYDGVIQKSIENGRSVGVSGTPTFFLNGRSFSGAQPFEVFERLIEEELTMSAAKSASR